MAKENWVNGASSGWASAFGTEINSLANGNAVLSSVSISNGTNLDTFADLSLIAGATVTTATPWLIMFYLYPLNEDGTTYGDGRFGTAAAGPPAKEYYIGSTNLQNTTITVQAVISRILIPPGTFKFLVYNQSGVAFAASNTCKYRTYNRSIA